MSFRLFNFGLIFLFMAISACVTVNVYFPESAAQRAADLFIRDVYGEDANRGNPATGADDGIEGEPQSLRPMNSLLDKGIIAIGNFLVSPATAQAPDINIQTPAINSLKGAMSARHQNLKSGYNSGAIGMASTGLLVLRDSKAVPLQSRNQMKQLIVQENKDRNKLYAEVAKANGHPEWEKEIRAIFAQRWVGNAPAGWWYESGGSWKQK
ncbi:MAG: YdbL family protein [Gammaproteobacteria bacterium]